MTTTKRDPALLARSAALNIGADAYRTAFERFDADAPLYALEAVKAAQVGLDVLTRQAVAQARAEGASWQQVADALGLASKQTAQQRYSTAQGTENSAPQPQPTSIAMTEPDGD